MNVALRVIANYPIFGGAHAARTGITSWALAPEEKFAMNHRIGARSLAMLLGILVVASPLKLHSQSVGSQPARISLNLGSVTVWLGMPQSDVLLQLQSAGYKVFGEGETRTVSIGDSPAMLGFKNGKLKYATREWYTSGQDEMEVVIRALTDLASYGGRDCSIVPDRMNNPDGSSDIIFVTCGERSLMFVKGKAAFKGAGEIPVVEVQERIGTN
jgi:hypothetical protein